MKKPFPLTMMVMASGIAVGGLTFQITPSFASTSVESTAESSMNTEQKNVHQDALSPELAGLDRITLGESASGEITSASELNGKDGSRFLRYVMRLDENALVELSLSGALRGVVTLYDDQMQLLKHAETVRHHINESGEYVVIVSGADARSYGPFTINSRVVELSDSDELIVGSPMDGWLDSAAREVTLSIEEAGMYRIEMRAEEFDAYLELSGPNDFYREDDDSAGNLDASISDFLAPGDYTLIARSAFGDGSGLFTLSAQPRELPGDGELRNDGTVMSEDTLNGWFSGQDVVYQLEIEEAGMYQIDMSSSDMDAYLVLEGPNGYYREDDDGAGNLDARIADFLAPGNYQLTARTAYGSGSGLFALAVKPRELPDDVELRNAGELTPGETLNGWYSGEPLTYTFTLEESALVTLDMRSNDFDTYLELYDENTSYSDDDGAGGTDSRLSQSLLPGTYSISARGFSANGSGLFELQMSTQPTKMQPDI
ncbi:PPC domain-containing protein [Vreelandella aquamarina]